MLANPGCLWTKAILANHLRAIYHSQNAHRDTPKKRRSSTVEDSPPKWLCCRLGKYYELLELVRNHIWWREDSLFLMFFSFMDGMLVISTTNLSSVQAIMIFVRICNGSSNLVGSNPVGRMTLPSLDLIQSVHIWNPAVISAVCSKRVVTLYRFSFPKLWIQLQYLSQMLHESNIYIKLPQIYAKCR